MKVVHNVIKKDADNYGQFTRGRQVVRAWHPSSWREGRQHEGSALCSHHVIKMILTVTEGALEERACYYIDGTR